MTDALAERLAERTLALVDVASESYDEAAILRYVREAAPGRFEPADDRDQCLLYLPTERRSGAPFVVFAGHVDTVPIAGNVPGRREADAIVGRGASDMKSGIAVMLETMNGLATSQLTSDLDLGFLFFGREEVSTEDSALPPLFDRTPVLTQADLAIVMEPTDNAVEIGCLGNLNARVVARGVAAHSARPWLGTNAIHQAIEALASIADLPTRDVEIDGLTYREVVNVTRIEGGVAANVLPDRVEATVNFRYAPTLTPVQAEARIRELLGHRAIDVEIVSNARPGPVTVRHPLVERLARVTDVPVRPKQAWTPVAEFADGGIDAVNLGPGDPAFAHRDDERVGIDALVRCYAIVAAFLAGGEVAP